MSYHLEYEMCKSDFGMNMQLLDPEIKEIFGEIHKCGDNYKISSKMDRKLPCFLSIEAAKYAALAEFIEWKEAGK